MKHAAAAKQIIGPTPEQAARSGYELSTILDKAANGRNFEVGKAHRKVRVLEDLFGKGLLSADEYKALKHYRHHADIADKSPLRDSILTLGRISTGSGDGPTLTTLNAIRTRDDCERAVGQLVDILRAVIVDDVSLSQWCIDHGHSIEKCRTRGAATVCKIEAKEGALRIAQLEIKIVAGRVQAELDA